MNEDKKNPTESNNVIAHFETFNLGPGTYCGGVIKLRANPKGGPPRFSHKLSQSC